MKLIVGDLMQPFALSCLITKTTCHHPKIETCIDIILTKKNIL